LKVMFVQFTDPGAYPPLQNAAQVLAQRGHDCLFVGLKRTDSIALNHSTNVRAELASIPSGKIGRYLQLLAFPWRVLRIAKKEKIDWLYGSDPRAAPALMLAKKHGFQVIYHEHDLPGAFTPWRERFVTRARKTVVAQANFLVAPNAARLARLNAAATGAPAAGHVVFNTPLLAEIAPSRPRPPGPLRCYFHGSVNPHSLPMRFLDMLGGVANVELNFAGYETEGSRGYINAVLDYAKALKIAHRVCYFGAFTRDELFQRVGAQDIGLASYNIGPEDGNANSMWGASNKIFDYLALGIVPLVDHAEEWQTLRTQGACISASPAQWHDVVHRFAAAPALLAPMAQRGRTLLLAQWNYEAQFQSVAALMEAGSATNSLISSASLGSQRGSARR
jgi:hypothetical protein